MKKTVVAIVACMMLVSIINLNNITELWWLYDI